MKHNVAVWCESGSNERGKTFYLKSVHESI